MKKYAGILSILFIIICLIPFLLTLFPESFSEYFFLISVISYFLAIILALIAEKGIWKTVALIALVIMTVVVIGFYVVMGMFWHQP